MWSWPSSAEAKNGWNYNFTPPYASIVCLGTTLPLPYLVSKHSVKPPAVAFHTVGTWCGRIRLLLNPDRTELIVFTRKRKLPGFFEPLFFWSSCATFYVGQVSRGSPQWSLWISRWRRLIMCCGPVGGPLVQHGAWSPRWSTGCMSLSLGHPSPLHF